MNQHACMHQSTCKHASINMQACINQHASMHQSTCMHASSNMLLMLKDQWHVTVIFSKVLFDLFYGPSTHFRSYRARSVNLATLFLGKPLSGKQTLWYLSFVYTSYISVRVQTALNFGKHAVPFKYCN